MKCNLFGTNAEERKGYPMKRGLLDYFPRALAAVARVSYIGNKQHNPGEPLHWAKEKSTDHEDCIIRHLMEGELDRVAWRALAALEMELEGVKEEQPEISCVICGHLTTKQCYDCIEWSKWTSAPEDAP